jgi:very-short-patch-repair endonuclease
MKKARQYRGGYQSAGMTRFARGLRTEETLAEGKLWQFLRNRQFLGLKFGGNINSEITSQTSIAVKQIW